MTRHVSLRAERPTVLRIEIQGPLDASEFIAAARECLADMERLIKPKKGLRHLSHDFREHRFWEMR